MGTWNGRRALAMLNLCPSATYYGFDLFEDATRETDADEMNVKSHHIMTSVYDLLHPPYDAHLYKGNTRATLATFNHPVDFVWLDGGHSVETIRSDWTNIKRCLTQDAWVYFDDYYSGGIDTFRFGCNEVVKDLRHDVLPERDAVLGGGWVQMVRVHV